MPTLFTVETGPYKVLVLANDPKEIAGHLRAMIKKGELDPEHFGLVYLIRQDAGPTLLGVTSLLLEAESP
jgi:hypothetical protein